MAETLISPGTSLRENDISFIAPAPLEAGAAIIGPTVKGPVEEPTVVTSYSDYSNIFGTTFDLGSNSQEFLTSIAVKSYFEQGGNSALVTRVVTGSYSAATSTDVVAEIANYTGSKAPFQLKTLSKGALQNTATGSASTAAAQNSDGSLVNGSADNVRYEIANINKDQGTFSLLIRRGDDTKTSKIILETFNDLSLDPNSGNYIEKVIGNQYYTKANDGDITYLNPVGEYRNLSRYVRVSSVNKTINYLGTDGVTIQSDTNGSNYSGSLPVAQSGSFYNATGVQNENGNFFSDITNGNTQGLTGGDYQDAVRMMRNKDEYLYNIISAPGLIYENGEHKARLDEIISNVQERGDAIAVIDLENYGANTANTAQTAATVNNSYAAAYWPWLQTQSGNGKLVWIPASTVIPGVYAFTDNAAAPWFAPAGLTRGGIPNVIQAERKLTRAQRDTLYAANVNPIATFPGAGIAVFGQKTLQKKSSALDRVNVRRLLIELKKFIGDVSRTLVFEQNTIATRNGFLAAVNPYLESVVQRQGLYAFKVVMDDTNNTADVIDRNQLIGQIFIQPAKTVEYILLDFSIEPSGATFGA